MESPVKKRKLRKGTHSCRECKRRKARCVFGENPADGEGDEVCVGCRRRGTICLAQDEEALWTEIDDRGETKVSNRRLERVEAMLEALIEGRGLSVKEKPENFGIQKLYSTKSTPSPSLLSHHRRFGLEPMGISISEGPGKTLSQRLHDLLPSVRECELLCSNAEFVPCFLQQLTCRNYLEICQLAPERALTRTRLTTLPPATAHPMILAQRLLVLVCITQYFPSTHLESIRHWKDRAQVTTNTVIELVMNNDDLVHSAEGLECLMLEATFYSNSGNLRRAFTTIRRAMALAQLLGIHRPDHQTPLRTDDHAPKFDSAYMWYRIVYLDRIYCLILGLPQGSMDTRFLNNVSVLPSHITFEEDLEKQHCIIASQILTRNEDLETRDTHLQTEVIDKALQAAASIPPSKWWFLPTQLSAESQPDRFLATGRLATQIFHFNLLNQTYIPYIFQRADPGSPSPPTAYKHQEYSKTACATASREILSRYLRIQESSLVVHTYMLVDFFTLIAAMTLLVLHIDNHWSQRSSHSPAQPPSSHILSHMRPSDRAMLERLVHHMSFKDTSTSSKGLHALQELLAMEEEACRFGSVGAGVIVKDKGADVGSDGASSGRFFEIRMPWYGCLRLNATKTCFVRNTEVKEVKTSIEEFHHTLDEIGGRDGTVGGKAGVEELGDGTGEFVFREWMEDGLGSFLEFDELNGGGVLGGIGDNVV